MHMQQNLPMPQREPHASPGAELSGQCLAVRVRMLNRVVSALYDEALRPHGLRITQLNVMAALDKVGPATPGAIANVLHLEASSLSRIVAVLRKQGWVRTLPTEDERSHELELTAKGRRLLAKALPAWRAAQARATRLLGEGGARDLVRIVDRCGLTAGWD